MNSDITTTIAVATTTTKQIPFWTQKPEILFNKKYIFEIWPTPCSSSNQKLNAITRLILIMSIMGYYITKKTQMLIIGAVSLLAIVAVQYMISTGMINQTQNRSDTASMLLEGFANENGGTTPKASNASTKNSHFAEYKDSFEETTPQNPFGNIMLPQINEEPNRLQAPPAYDREVEQNINDAVKQMVVDNNPTIDSLKDKIFSDIGDNLVFEQSMRQFYSSPNTLIPNDQEAFAQFCYGDMISCKEGNELACARNMPRHQHI